MISSRLAPLALAALAAGCGNYSNSEVEYLNALPSREDLRSNLPQGTAQQKAALAAARSALAPSVPILGMTSKLFEDTKGAALFFGAIADAFVNLVDQINRVPPTSSDGTSRTWGPWTEGEHPEVEFQAIIERQEPSPGAYEFTYSLSFRRKADPPDAWVAVITGHYTPTGTGRNGAGALHFDNAALVIAGLQDDPNLYNLDWLDIGYDRTGWPIATGVEFRFHGGSTYHFSHRQFADGRGTMTFVVDDDLHAWTMDVSSRWLADGGGRADVAISSFMGPVGSETQCWDKHFLLTFHSNTAEAPNLLGSPESCPAGLPDL